MNKKPLSQLVKDAQNLLNIELPVTDLPEEHSERSRAYYEGVIACVETKGGKLFTKSTYSKNGPHYKAWKAGWDFAKPIYEKNQNQRKETFKFLRKVG